MQREVVLCELRDDYLASTNRFLNLARQEEGGAE